MRVSGCKLASDCSGVHEDSVSVSGLLSFNLQKYLTPMKLSRFMNDNIEDFLPGRKS